MGRETAKFKKRSRQDLSWILTRILAFGKRKTGGWGDSPKIKSTGINLRRTKNIWQKRDKNISKLSLQFGRGRSRETGCLASGGIYCRSQWLKSAAWARLAFNVFSDKPASFFTGPYMSFISKMDAFQHWTSQPEHLEWILTGTQEFQLAFGQGTIVRGWHCWVTTAIWEWCKIGPELKLPVILLLDFSNVVRSTTLIF